MKSEKQLSLTEFVSINSPIAWSELNSIVSEEQYPFSRSNTDLENGYLERPSELPFANPKAAEAALRKWDLKRLVWRHACEVMTGEEWECRGRPEGELDWRTLPAKLLSRGDPNFSEDRLWLLGQLYEDVEFVRISRVSADERALEVIKHFCDTHDPGAHIVAHVVRAIETEASLCMSKGHVRQLMSQAGIDERWFAPGRRAARCAACKP